MSKTLQQRKDEKVAAPRTVVDTELEDYAEKSTNKKLEEMNKVEEPAPTPIFNNPYNMQNEEYTSYVAGGGDMDVLHRVKTYDPNKGNPILENLYTKSIKKPQEVDERKVKASRTATNIGEAIGSLAELAGSLQGARTRDRQFTANDKNEAQIKDIRNLYQVQNDRYDSGLLNAKVNDYQIGEGNHQRDRAELTNNVREIRAAKALEHKQEIENAKWLREQGFKEGTAQAEQALKEKAQYETSKQNRAQNGIGWYNARTGRINAERERKANSYSWSSGYGGKDGKTAISQITIPAAPGDNTKYQLPTGEWVIDFKVKPSQVPYFANQGKLALTNDAVFQAKYKDAIEKASASGDNSLVELLGGAKSGKSNREADEVIGAFYAQYKYEQDNGMVSLPIYNINSFEAGGSNSFIKTQPQQTKYEIR